MGTEWFYEYEGRECGPIPAETLLHLARHGAISRESRVRKQGMTQLVAAEKVKGLFTPGGDGAPATCERSEDAVSNYLRMALDHCVEGTDGELMRHTPLIGCIWPWSGKVLLAYEIRGIQKLPTPIVDMSLPLGQRTKPVKAMFQAVLKASLCEWPAYPTTLAEVRRMEPGKEQGEFVLICKEFEDGDWLFMYSSLEA